VRSRAFLAAAAACGLALAGCGGTSSTTASSGQASGSPIQIGFIGTYSGPFAISTQAVQDTLNVWVDSVNSSGGVLGHRLQVVTRDDQGSSQTALQDAKDLVQSGVNIIVGPVINGPALQPLQGPLNFIQYTILPEDQLNDPKQFPYTFNTYSENILDIEKIGQATVARGQKKWAILTDTLVNDSTLGTQMAQEAQKVGAQVVLNKNFSLNTTDFSSYVSQVASSGADALILFTLGPDVSNFLSAVGAANLSIPIYGNAAITASDLSSVPAKVLENQVNVSVVKSALLQNGQPIPGYIPLTRALYAKYGKSSVKGSGMTVQFDTFEMIGYAIRQAGGDDPAKMRHVMEYQVRNKYFLSPQVRWTFTPTDHGGYPKSPDDMVLVRPELSTVWPGYYSTAT
jgi:ABC-type branched-subunit amino acid transport system substrate-binding protein